ncbi:MAG TPA: hypothetical protein DCQ98_06160 [Planctomycetaceae bacterium]|nr:hypothetical protein [Planctomycetaceae bacterium]
MVGMQRQRAEQKRGHYRELVAAIASGSEPSPTEIEQLLTETQKSVDDLRRDVEKQQHRAKLKASVASIPGFEAERAAIDAQIAAADKKLAESESQHEETVHPLHLRRREVDQAISDGEAARRELVSSCEDADLRRELEDINQQLQRAGESTRDYKDSAGRLDRMAAYEHEVAGHELIKSEAARHREQAVTYETEAESLRRKAKKLEKLQADLAKRCEEIEQQMRRS